MNDGAPRMVFLGFGKYVRADKIYALEPLGEGLRGHGARTRVWVDGISEPIVASRTERAIITAMGGSPADSVPGLEILTARTFLDAAKLAGLTLPVRSTFGTNRDG